MAEVLARRLLASPGTLVHVSSAGLHAEAGQPASENARAVAREKGEDLSTHRTRMLDRALVRESDLILTMTRAHRDEILREYPSARGRVYSLSEFSGLSGQGDLVDPYGGDLSRYRETWASIESHLRAARTRLVKTLEESR